MTKVFNYYKFYRDLNTSRKLRGISWNKVATRTGMPVSVMHSFVKQFEEPGSATKKMALENVVKLLDWMNKTDLAPYMVEEDHPDVVG